MTLSEFKAWFEGYTEGLESAPTKAQFERIKEKVKEISGTPITYPVYIDRYVEPYRHYWQNYTTTWGGNSVGTTMAGDGLQGMATAYNSAFNGSNAFDSHAAMYAAGKAEAAMN